MIQNIYLLSFSRILIVTSIILTIELKKLKKEHQ